MGRNEKRGGFSGGKELENNKLPKFLVPTLRVGTHFFDAPASWEVLTDVVSWAGRRETQERTGSAFPRGAWERETTNRLVAHHSPGLSANTFTSRGVTYTVPPLTIFNDR